MELDKIYINKQFDVFGYYNAQKNPPYEEEYIRKDALLEWVKERKNINLEEADEKNDMFFYGVATGFAAMIDKLNSM